jgi:hypothetical protein
MSMVIVRFRRRVRQISRNPFHLSYRILLAFFLFAYSFFCLDWNPQHKEENV